MIRKINSNDLDIIMNIWLTENIAAHNFIPENYWKNNFENVKKAISENNVFVFVKNNQIKGFIGLIDNYIAGIFIKKEFQKKGIGKLLLDKCKQKYSKLTLNVYSKNIKAVKFYKNNSFEIKEEKNNLEVNQIEYRMEWNKT